MQHEHVNSPLSRVRFGVGIYDLSWCLLCGEREVTEVGLAPEFSHISQL